MADALQEMSVFSRVVASGSLSAAARELGISPALVSRRLAALENRLGVRLINRTTRSLHLTVVADYSAAPSDPDATGIVIPLEGNASSVQVIETGRSLLLPISKDKDNGTCTRSCSRACSQPYTHTFATGLRTKTGTRARASPAGLDSRPQRIVWSSNENGRSLSPSCRQWPSLLSSHERKCKCECEWECECPFEYPVIASTNRFELRT